MAELVDALDLKSNWYLNASVGSSPTRGTLSPCKSIDYDLQGFFVFTAFNRFCQSGYKVVTREYILTPYIWGSRSADFVREIATSCR